MSTDPPLLRCASAPSARCRAVIPMRPTTWDTAIISSRTIAGIRPGEQTANYIDSVLARLTVFGAIYLTLICLLPLALINFAGISPTISVGGTSVLIIVVVLMDFMAQVQSHMMSTQYASLMKKANLKNYKR